MTLRVAFQHGIHANGSNVDYRHCLDAAYVGWALPTEAGWRGKTRNPKIEIRKGAYWNYGFRVSDFVLRVSSHVVDVGWVERTDCAK